MKGVVIAENYDRIDGRVAYKSEIKKLTLGAPVKEENKHTPIAAQIWKETEGVQEIYMELPMHRIIDLMIFLSRTLLYFKDAYRMPLLYDPQNPAIQRVGLQGDAMSISVCTENPNINEDIQAFSQAINDMGELNGERLMALARILEELEY